MCRPESEATTNSRKPSFVKSVYAKANKGVEKLLLPNNLNSSLGYAVGTVIVPSLLLL